MCRVDHNGSEASHGWRWGRSWLSHSFHLWVTEMTLQVLELIEEMDWNDGVEIGESLKAVYFTVAVECTVKYLAFRGSDGKYFKAVKRVWRGRISNLGLHQWRFWLWLVIGLWWFCWGWENGALVFMNLYLS